MVKWRWFFESMLCDPTSTRSYHVTVSLQPALLGCKKNTWEECVHTALYIVRLSFILNSALRPTQGSRGHHMRHCCIQCSVSTHVDPSSAQVNDGRSFVRFALSKPVQTSIYHKNSGASIRPLVSPQSLPEPPTLYQPFLTPSEAGRQPQLVVCFGKAVPTFGSTAASRSPHWRFSGNGYSLARMNHIISLSCLRIKLINWFIHYPTSTMN